MFIKKFNFHLPSRASLVHRGEHCAHLFYLGAVSVEAHGIYAYGAAGLFVMVVLTLIVKEAE